VGRATPEEWSRYYAVAARKRREIGGDPFTNYLRKYQAKQKVLFVGSSLFLVGLVTVLYTVLTG
jgi:hypothetical protein